jgi:gamma-glutamyltranspeptidase
MNYEVKLKKFSSGLNIIHIDKNLYGGSDHRREGIAIGQ